MTRIRLLPLVLVGAAAMLLTGHSPYRQWFVYRARHLIVVTDELRPEAFALASAVASAIAARWPETKAVAAAAKSPLEVVKLLDSGQLDVGLVPAAVAAQALHGQGGFEGRGEVPLRAVAALGDDLLVVLASFPRQRAHDIAQALVESRTGSGLGKKTSLRGPATIPLHPGALAYYQGAPGG